MKLADQVADFLARQGLKRVFGIPGTESLPLIEALEERGVDFVLTRHESAAAFMADATAYLTGDLQACVTTKGPGAINLLLGATSAYYDGSPVLAITGEVPRHRRARFTHQATDLDALYAPVSKGSFYLTPENAAEVLPQAASLAMAEKPGTVRLGLSGYEAERDAQGEPVPARVDAVPVDEAALQAVAQELARAQRPFVLVGEEVWRARQTEALVRLAERLGLPVAVTPRAKGVFPESHPNYCRVLTFYQDAPIRALIDESDLVLAVGVDGAAFQNGWSFRTPVVSLSSIGPDPVPAPRVHARGDLRASLEFLLSLPSREGWGTDAAGKCRQEIDRLFVNNEPCQSCLSPQSAARILKETLPADTIVTVDVGSHRLVVGQIWQTAGPGRFIGPSGLTGMGGGVPSAIAASLELPGERVAAVVGDGGMLMTTGELETLVRVGSHALVVVFNDRTLSSIKRKRDAQGHPTTEKAVVTGRTNFATLAGSFGIPAFRANSETELAKAVESWQRSGGPTLVDVTVEYAYYRSMSY